MSTARRADHTHKEPKIARIHSRNQSPLSHRPIQPITHANSTGFRQMKTSPAGDEINVLPGLNTSVTIVLQI